MCLFVGATALGDHGPGKSAAPKSDLPTRAPTHVEVLRFLATLAIPENGKDTRSSIDRTKDWIRSLGWTAYVQLGKDLSNRKLIDAFKSESATVKGILDAAKLSSDPEAWRRNYNILIDAYNALSGDEVLDSRRRLGAMGADVDKGFGPFSKDELTARRRHVGARIAADAIERDRLTGAALEQKGRQQRIEQHQRELAAINRALGLVAPPAGPMSVLEKVHAFYESPEKFIRHAAGAPKEAVALLKILGMEKLDDPGTHDAAPAYWALRRVVNASDDRESLRKGHATGMGTAMPHGLVDLIDRAPSLSATDFQEFFAGMSRREFDTFFEGMRSGTRPPGFDRNVWVSSFNRVVAAINAFRHSPRYAALGAVPKGQPGPKGGPVPEITAKTPGEMLDLFFSDRPAFDKGVLSSPERSRALTAHIESLVRGLDPKAKSTPATRDRLLQAYWPARLAHGELGHDPVETYAPMITRFKGETHHLAGTPEPFRKETGGDFSLHEAAFVDAFDQLDDAARRRWLSALPVKAMLNFFGRLRGEGGSDGSGTPAGFTDAHWNKQANRVQEYIRNILNDEPITVSKLYQRAIADPQEAKLFVRSEWQKRRSDALHTLMDIEEKLQTPGKAAGPTRTRLEAEKTELVSEIGQLARILGERPPTFLATGLDYITLLRTDPNRFQHEVAKIASQPGGHAILQDLAKELTDSHLVAHRFLPEEDRNNTLRPEEYQKSALIARDLISLHLPESARSTQGFGQHELWDRARKLEADAVERTKAICSEPSPLTLERFLLAEGARFNTPKDLHNGHRQEMRRLATGKAPEIPLIVKSQHKRGAVDPAQFLAYVRRLSTPQLVEMQQYYEQKGDTRATPASQLEVIRGLLAARAFDGAVFAQHYVNLLGMGLEKVPSALDVRQLLKQTGTDPARFARFLFFSAQNAEALADLDKSCRNAFTKTVPVYDPRDPSKKLTEERNEVADAFMRLRRMVLIEGSTLDEGGMQTAHELWSMDDTNIEALVGAIATAPVPQGTDAAAAKAGGAHDDPAKSAEKGGDPKSPAATAKSGDPKGGSHSSAKGHDPLKSVTPGHALTNGRPMGLYDFLIHLQHIRASMNKGNRLRIVGSEDLDRPIHAIAAVLERTLEKKLMDFALAVRAGNTAEIQKMIEKFRETPFLQTMAILTKANEKENIVPPEVVAAVQRVLDRRESEFNTIAILMERERQHTIPYKAFDGKQYFFLPDHKDGQPRLMTQKTFDDTLKKRLDGFRGTLEEFYVKVAAKETGGNRLFEAVLQTGFFGLGADPNFKTAEHLEATQAEKDLRRAIDHVKDLAPGSEVMTSLYKASMDAAKHEGKLAQNAATSATWIAAAICAAPIGALIAPAALPAGATWGTFIVGKLVVPALIGASFSAFGSIATQSARIAEAKSLGKDVSFDWGEFWTDTRNGALIGVGLVNLPAGLGAYAIPAAGTFVAIDSLGQAHVNFRDEKYLAGSLDVLNAAASIALMGKLRRSGPAPAAAPAVPPAQLPVVPPSRWFAALKAVGHYGSYAATPAMYGLSGNIILTNPEVKKAYSEKNYDAVPWSHDGTVPAVPKDRAKEELDAAPTDGLVRHVQLLRDPFVEHLAKLGANGNWVDVGDEFDPSTARALEEYLAPKANQHFKASPELDAIYGKAPGQRARVTSFTRELPPGVGVKDFGGRLRMLKGESFVETNLGDQSLNQGAMKKLVGDTKGGVDIITDTRNGFLSSSSFRPDIALRGYLSALRKGGAAYLSSPQLVMSKVEVAKGVTMSMGDWIKKSIEDDPDLAKMVRVEWGGGRGGINDPLILRVVESGVGAYLAINPLPPLDPLRPRLPADAPAGTPRPLPLPPQPSNFGPVYHFIQQE